MKRRWWTAICSDVTSFQSLRGSIPLLGDTVYLNTGASGPTPQPVEAAVQQASVEHGESHRSDPYGYLAEAAEDSRSCVADLVGCSVDQVALTSNTTEAINRVADCYRWSEADTVVTTELEHPAGRLPWQRLSEVHGVEVHVVSADETGVDQVEFRDAVEDAKLACFSSRSWLAVDLSVETLVEIAHDRGCDVVVDAAQSIGAEAVDVTDWGADYVAAPGHKWLLAPWGTGFLYAREPSSCGGQTRAGYRSSGDPDGSMELYDDARRFHVSTESPALLRGLEAAVDMFGKLDAEEVEQRIEDLATQLEESLGDRVVSRAGGLVRFTAEDPNRTVEWLKEDDVVLRALPDDSLRASVHAFNTEGDVERLLEAI